MSPGSLVHITNLKKHFLLKRNAIVGSRGRVYAVDGVSLDLGPGETLGLVGESGCGKSTLGRTILRLLEPTEGTIVFDGQDITHLKGRALKKLRAEMQIVFQDPYSSLNPRLKVENIVGDALKAHGLAKGSEVTDRVADTLLKVGIHREKMKAYPHEFSGGQRQRIGIARAIILKPRLIVCDEPVSALDLSIQAQVINLLSDLRAEFNLSYIMIAHDLSVINHVSNRIAVMYLGKIIELATNRELLGNPLHPYTQALISAIPILDPDKKKKRIIPTGELPSPINPPSGCHFHPRCPQVMEICRKFIPEWAEIVPGHFTMCHLYEACRKEQ
ncbi:MAG: peptide ABC transporter substrate-binding protein [Deltaproteobacteria bacterium RBG_13_53_10]|nr:MAG: peptide ABC transporter substrate-binding protein [Deltaproteobacteria bacterium RBG_13_53_10]